jgi:hydrogenase/urease accessory protein HupE
MWFIFSAFVASVLLGVTVHSTLTKAPAWKTAISAALTLFSSLLAVRFCFIEFYGYIVKISEVLISYMK